MLKYNVTVEQVHKGSKLTVNLNLKNTFIFTLEAA